MRKRCFILTLIMIFLCCIFAFSVFAEESDARLDSFAVTDEYRDIASSANLLEKLKERTSFYDDSIEYVVMYDNIVAEFSPNISFTKRMQDGEVSFEDADSWSSPLLYIPIVDAATSQTITYAATHKGETVEWFDRQGEVITKESLDTKLGINGTYVFLDLTHMKYVYCQESNGFYGYTRLPGDGDIGKYRTIDEASKDYEHARKQGSKMFWSYLLPGLLYYILSFAFSFVVLPILGISLVIFLIWLTVFLIRRKRKKRAKSSGADSDTTATET